MGKGAETSDFIRELSWTPLIVHTVELRARNESDLFSDVRRELSERIDWLVFMSPEGVRVLFSLLRTHSILLSSMLGNPRIVAVGPKTRDALLGRGVQDVLVPQSYSAEGVAELLSSSSSLNGKRVVLARSSEADETLARTLTMKGANVSTITVYSSILPENDLTVRKLIDALKGDLVDGILFTSALSASSLFRMGESIVSSNELARLLQDCLVEALGPVTARKLSQLGIEPDIQPDHYLIEEALILMVETLRKEQNESAVLTSPIN